MPKRIRAGPRWEQATRTTINRARHQPTGPHCRICRQPINLNLPYRRPDGTIEPNYRTIDHIIPLAYGGPPYDPDNLALAHLKCQRTQGGTIAAHLAKQRTRHKRRTTNRPNQQRTPTQIHPPHHKR